MNKKIACILIAWVLSLQLWAQNTLFNSNITSATEVSNWTLNRVAWNPGNNGQLVFATRGSSVIMPALPTETKNMVITISARYGNFIHLHTSPDGKTYTDQGLFAGSVNTETTSKILPDGTRYVKFTAKMGTVNDVFLISVKVHEALYVNDIATETDVSNWTLNKVIWNSRNSGQLIFATEGSSVVMPVLPAEARNMHIVISARYSNYIRLQTSSDGKTYTDQGLFEGNNRIETRSKSLPNGTRYVKLVTIAGTVNDVFLLSVIVTGDLPTLASGETSIQQISGTVSSQTDGATPPLPRDVAIVTPPAPQEQPPTSIPTPTPTPEPELVPVPAATGITITPVVPSTCNQDTPGWGSNLGMVFFVSARTWTIGNQTWSDEVFASACRKTSFDGGTWNPTNFNADCRSNLDPWGEIFSRGSLFSWCAVVRFADQLCPAPWRVPTAQDFVDLDIALGGTGKNRIDDRVEEFIRPNYIDRWGGIFGGRAITNQSRINNQSISGLYYSQTQSNSESAFLLNFDTRKAVRPQISGVKSDGFLLRCVRDN
ncbi:MAG: fibrobacter succinogenes major paralogous domain-containing protein [Bacteroidales bacterium]|nr:fibrobacter succinogenes major paralogous domain-containing protein [Bacteroidales bacterium]